jgi:hypothetical protein
VVVHPDIRGGCGQETAGGRATLPDLSLRRLDSARIDRPSRPHAGRILLSVESARFRSEVSSTGVLIAEYVPDGEVRTGSF